MTDELNADNPVNDPTATNDDASGLKTALQKEREARRELEKTAKAFTGLGLSPEEIAELKAGREKAEEERAKQAGEWDKLREKLAQQHETQLAALKAQLESVAKSEHEARVQSGLMSALVEAGATDEGANLLPEILKHRARIEQDGDKRAVKIFDADGSPMINKNGRDATFADLVASAAEKYPSLFKAQTKPGSGTPHGGNRAGSSGQTVKAATLAAMSVTEKAAYFKANPNITVTE